MKDEYRHKGQRRKMIDELRALGISNEEVLEAIDGVPRHFFLSSAFEQFAYQNKAFQIGSGQTISKPHTVAKQTELLDLGPGKKVLVKIWNTYVLIKQDRAPQRTSENNKVATCLPRLE